MKKKKESLVCDTKEDFLEKNTQILEKLPEESREIMSYVDYRLNILYSLKSFKYPAYWQIRNEYAMWKEQRKDDDYARYRMNTGFAIVNTKAAEVLTNIPRYDFIALDDDARKYRKIREQFWNWLWTTSKTDEAIYRIVIDAMKYGTGWGIEHIVTEKRTIKEPFKNPDGTITWKEKEVVDYDGCKLERIEWSNVFVNGYDINHSTEAAIITYYERNDFMSKFGNNPEFYGVNEENIPYGKYYYVATNLSDTQLNLVTPGTGIKDTGMDTNNIVSVCRYYNKSLDEYIVLANGVWINPVKTTSEDSSMNEEGEEREIMGIPTPSKEIPLVCMTDNYLEDNIWGMGEYEISKDSRDLKDETRSLILESVKNSFGMIVLDPESDLDEAEAEIGSRKIIRAKREDISHFPINTNSSILQYLEAKIDEDLIIETGVDFKGQILGQNETATKTDARKNAARKRINLMLKFNAYTFFERLARLRSSNIEFWYKDTSVKITTPGIEISPTKRGGLKIEANNGGYGTFTCMPIHFKGKFNVIPNLDSLLGKSSAEDKQKYMEALQLFSNMTDPTTGKPVINPRNFIEAGRGIMDDVVDIDKLLETTESEKSPESILRDSGLDVGGVEASLDPRLDPSYIAPAQRSGKAVLLPSSAAPKE